MPIQQTNAITEPLTGLPASRRGRVVRQACGLAAVVLAMCAGCTQTNTFGRDFNDSATSSIKVGATTRSQVQGMLGEPFRREVSPQGGENWTYLFTRSEYKGPPGLYATMFPGSERTQAKSLYVNFTKDVVSDCTLSTVSSETSGTMSERGMQSGLGGGTQITTKCGQ